MSEYIKTVTVALFFSGICSFVFADGKSSVSKYVKLVCSLCVVCTVVYPVLSAVKNFSFEAPELEQAFDVEYGDVEEKTDRYILDMTKQKLDKTVSDTVYEKFGIKAHSCDIQLSVKEIDGSARVDIESVSLTVSRIYEKDVQKVSAYLETILGTPAEIALV